MNTLTSSFELCRTSKLAVRQRREMAELFGFETRNKYEINDSQGKLVAFAAEQQKGILGLLMRQMLGHWRTFSIHIFDVNREKVMVAHRPFRFFFQRLEISDAQGKPLGAIQQRFAFLTKRFDVLDGNSLVAMQVASPIFKIWTFPFTYRGKTLATVQKKWAGLLAEGFTDKDNFEIDFSYPALTETQRRLILAAALFIDLQYFEKKARN